jgi:hypothetical protein
VQQLDPAQQQEELVQRELDTLVSTVQSASLSGEQQLLHLHFEQSRIQTLIDGTQPKDDFIEQKATSNNLSSESVFRCKQRMTLQMDEAVNVVRTELMSLAQITQFAKTYAAAVHFKDVPQPFDRSNSSKSIKSMVAAGLTESSELVQLQTLMPSDYFAQEVNKVLQQVSRATNCTRRNVNETIWEGTNVLLSDVVQAQTGQNISKVLYVVAHGTVFVDSDLHLEDTHLVVVASTINIVASRTIHSKGADASGTPGPLPRVAVEKLNSTIFTGTPGSSGFTSGQVQINAHTVINGKDLTINMVGGNGGQGGPGADRSFFEASLSLPDSCIDCPVMCDCCKTCQYAIFKYSDDSPVRYTPYYEIAVYTNKELAAGLGGTGGNAASAGGAFVNKFSGEDFVMHAANGTGGAGGCGGAGDTYCSARFAHIVCRGYKFCNNDCFVRKTGCKDYSTPTAAAASGAQGVVDVSLRFLFPVPDFESQLELIAHGLSDLYDSQSYADEALKFLQVYVAMETTSNKSGIRSIYNILFKMADQASTSRKTSILAQQVYQIFLSRKESIVAVEKAEDVLHLETLIFSLLDVGEASKKKTSGFKS